MNWVSFFVGAATGWLLEWVIDIFYWRRQSGELQMRLETSAASARQIDANYQACRQKVIEAEQALATAQADAGKLRDQLAAKQAEVTHLQAVLKAAEAAAAELRAQQAPEAAAKRAAIIDAGVVPDDLTLVEGIGPKIAGILNDGGIRTFGQLASTSVERLQALLDQAGPRYRLADPGSWPEQAELAAAGDMAALQTLQDSLKGGREAADTSE